MRHAWSPRYNERLLVTIESPRDLLDEVREVENGGAYLELELLGREEN